MPRYPDIEPYETGLLGTGDGNLVYWETCGNPDGVPALTDMEQLREQLGVEKWLLRGASWG